MNKTNKTEQNQQNQQNWTKLIAVLSQSWACRRSKIQKLKLEHDKSYKIKTVDL